MHHVQRAEERRGLIGGQEGWGGDGGWGKEMRRREDKMGGGGGVTFPG